MYLMACLVNLFDAPQEGAPYSLRTAAVEYLPTTPGMMSFFVHLSLSICRLLNMSKELSLNILIQGVIICWQDK